MEENTCLSNWVRLIGLPKAAAKSTALSRNRRTKKTPDAVEFARKRLGFPADEKQALVLRGGRRVIVNCARQWGKSTVAAAKAVHRAVSRPGSLILVVAPTLRQS